MSRNHLRRLTTLFSRKNSTPKRSVPVRVRWPGLALEPLEDRLVMSGNPYPTLYQEVTNYFNTAAGVLHTLTDLAQAKIPVVDKSFADLTKTNNVIQMINADIQQAQNDLMQFDQNTLAKTVADTFDKYLKPILHGPTVVQFGDNHHPNIIDVKLDLGSTIFKTQTHFGLALPGVPFKANGMVDAQVDWSLPVEFGLDANTKFFANPGKLDFHVFAGLGDKSQLTGDLGFLYFSAVSNHTGFDGHVSLSLDGSGNMTAPILSGSAGVDLNLSAGFSQDKTAPSIAANFYLDWTFSNDPVNNTNGDFGSHFSAGFKHVSFSFGDYLSQVVKPVAEKVQQITAPLQPFIKAVTTPLPLISDLAEVLGDKNGVSLLDIAGIANGSGQIPQPYSTYVSLATDIIEIVKLIDQFQLSGKSVQIPLDDIDLAGAQKGKDLRDLLKDTNFLNPDKLDWSHLQKFVSNIDPKVIEQKIHTFCTSAGVGPLGDLINAKIDDLKKKFDAAQANRVDWEFPILDDPGSAIANLLIGRDSDLVTFNAGLNLGPQNEQSPPGFDLPGFHVGLSAGVTVDAKITLGVDTHGLREVAHDLMQPNPQFHPEKLLDGNYVTTDSHLNLSGTLGLNAGFNYVAFHADATLSLTVAAGISIIPGADKDGDGKIHLNEIPTQADKLFNITGSLSGSLHAEAKVGIGPFSIGPSVDLGPAEFLSFNIGKINPFRADDNTVLASRAADGTLTLNMGPNAGARKYAVDVLDEDFLVTHDDPKPGDKGGEAVLVTAFGITQRYDGVKSIYADGGTGSDSITIGEKVTHPVELHGGVGNDRLEARGSGAAQLFGEGDNDILLGGTGKATLNGGAGDDHLTGGKGDVTMLGGAGKDVLQGGDGHNVSSGDEGDDLLIGGSGINVLSGGAGNDHLIAGPQADILNGEGGDDYLEAGARTAQLLGGAGQDGIVWHFQNQVDGNITPSTPVIVDGGNGLDSLAFFGSKADDTVMLAKLAGSPGMVQLQASSSAGGGVTIQIQNTETIDIEGGRGGDQITVDDLSKTIVSSVLVDVDDVNLTRLGQGDNVVDHVVVNGSPGDDMMSVLAEQDPIQITRDEKTILGGITAIQGLYRYDVRVGNVNDDLRIRALDGSDTVTLKGITGPTTIYGNGKAAPVGPDNDVFNVIAMDNQSFLTGLAIDAGFGSNALNVMEPAADSTGYVVNAQQVTSGLLHTLSYISQGGTFGQGVKLTTGPGPDNVRIASTLPGVATSVDTGLGNDLVLVSSGPAGNLAGIQGSLSIETGGGANTLTLDDSSAQTGNQAVAIHPHQITGLAGPADNTAVNYQATMGQLQLHVLGADKANLKEQFLVDSPAAALTLDTGAGDHVVNITGLTQTALINGNAGADTINVGYSVNTLLGLQGALAVKAGGGLDVMNVFDQSALAGHAYTISGIVLTRSGASPISFDSSLERIALQTTEFNDTVAIQVLQAGQSVSLDGHNGNDQLAGPNSDSTWTINAHGGGQIGANVKFSNFESLLGGSGNDRFVMANTQSSIGAIDGGVGGNDILDFSAFTTPINVSLQSMKATNVAAWKNLESFVGGNSAQDLFVGSSVPNSFHITGLDQGQDQTLGAGNYLFAGIENLQGGSNPDMFIFVPAGQLTGGVDGGAGNDLLDYSAFTHGMSVDLSKLTASHIGGKAASIEGVAGGEGDDTLIGDANPNLLSGNGGNDLLIGGAGKDSLSGGAGADVLIGGAGGDLLNGGLDEDLLIGGATAFDANSAALSAIMAEWGSSGVYSHRVADLRGPISGLNNPYFLKSNTVLEDSAADTLTGGADKNDWFWASKGNFADLITDLDAAHELVN